MMKRLRFAGLFVVLCSTLVFGQHPLMPPVVRQMPSLPLALVQQSAHEVLGARSLTVGSAGGSSSVVFTHDGDWTATANDSFLHISSGSASGRGSGIVVFSYDAFSGTGTRSGTLTIGGVSVVVTQVGVNYVGPGRLTTVVQSSLKGPKCVAVDAAGNLYIADAVSNAIEEWSPSTQQLTQLVSSGLNAPGAVAVDRSGNVFVADTGNSAIKRWSASTHEVMTIVSTGLNHPTGVALDAAGNLYITDSGNDRVVKWNASTQAVTTVVSTGLRDPGGIAIDAAGDLYIADRGNNAVKQWSSSKHQVTTLVSSGLNRPSAVAVDGSGNVFIADTGNNKIKEWSASTRQTTTLVSGRLSKPAGLSVDSNGSVYIADTLNGSIKELPYTFVGSASLNEPASGRTNGLLHVLPATTLLTGMFEPTSDQEWLSIDSVENGAISYSSTANSGSTRKAHITVLGQQLTVTQQGNARSTVNAAAKKSSQTITFGGLANQTLGAAPFTISATASSGLAVSFASLTSSVCTVAGSTVTLAAVGTCTIQATQSGNTNYAAATPVNQSFQVTQTVISGTTPTRVQSQSCTGASPVTCNFNVPATAGNTILLFAASSFNPCTSVTSSPANIWTMWGRSGSGDNAQMSVWVANNVASGTNSIVMTCPSSSLVSGGIVEIAGATTADVVNIVSGSGTGVSMTTSGSVGSSNEYVACAWYEVRGYYTQTAGPGYTRRQGLRLSGGNYLGAVEDQDLTTGLSGPQTCTGTMGSSAPWGGGIISFANTGPQSADVLIDFEGLTNGATPTQAALRNSVRGPMGPVWNTSSGFSANLTGANTAQLSNFVTAKHIGANDFNGSGSMGLQWATQANGGGYVTYNFPRSTTQASYLMEISTTLPQNDGNSHRYSLATIQSVGGTEYVNPQIIANGSTLELYLECKTNPSTAHITMATNTNYWVYLQAGVNGATNTMKVYDTAGVQVGQTATCTSSSGATTLSAMEIGVTGAEAEQPGYVIRFDNALLSLTGAALVP